MTSHRNISFGYYITVKLWCFINMMQKSNNICNISLVVHYHKFEKGPV